jgi:hypothetical protein
MSHGEYAPQVEAVQEGIAAVRAEPDASLLAELEDEQRAAGTNLEWYGITGSVFERFLASRPLSPQTRAALEKATHAVRVIFGSAT